MAFDDASANGEANPGAFVIIAAVQALEGSKDFFGIAMIDADSIIAELQLEVFRQPNALLPALQPHIPH